MLISQYSRFRVEGKPRDLDSQRATDNEAPESAMRHRLGRLTSPIVISGFNSCFTTLALIR
jgi:hypothetical protein